ncbi:hypothetical protein [Rhizobium leguminosarum]|uniref:hypothetical protein n=1 Tax=Rhizobium leguminosarum TaxID=384 RepID=UPI0024B3378B|nr:hypothetical protein [Rhizobium leguminosarum]WHO82580.1 hypothetical protein QMO81_005449 [Rhizobium leguminosarum]
MLGRRRLASRIVSATVFVACFPSGRRIACLPFTAGFGSGPPLGLLPVSFTLACGNHRRWARLRNRDDLSGNLGRLPAAKTIRSVRAVKPVAALGNIRVLTRRCCPVDRILAHTGFAAVDTVLACPLCVSALTMTRTACAAPLPGVAVASAGSAVARPVSAGAGVAHLPAIDVRIVAGKFVDLHVLAADSGAEDTQIGAPAFARHRRIGKDLVGARCRKIINFTLRPRQTGSDGRRKPHRHQGGRQTKDGTRPVHDQSTSNVSR